MNNYFIILASGQSKRFNSTKPKQFIKYKNKALFEHSVDKAISSKLFKKIILVINDKKQIKNKYPKNVMIINGGKERSDSSLKSFDFTALSTECSKRALFLYFKNCFGLVELNLLLCPEASIIK